MNFNLSILSLLLSLTLLICSIFELILMFKKKEFKLFILIIIFLVFGSFTENLLLSTSTTIGLGLALTAAIIAIKIIFYQRHKTDKYVRTLFYVQMPIIDINVATVIIIWLYLGL